ncbi:protein kinase [Actinosynnema sp. NPDC023587]|uniref:serine/threonine-protein kinase n=1 Tax=Actinosynnema sp. NPDC023587 TaxID=3154695 RepID=UPI003409726A
MSRSLDTDLLAGRYRLLEPIGAGDTVRAHRAWDELLRRHVAVKVFAPMTDPAAGRRFDEEVGALARLSHPSLASIYDTDVHEGSRFIVLRLVEGPTLRELVDQGPLPVDQVCRLGTELADALDHVHSHRLVHGEVRATNILVDDEGVACLADFSLGHPARAVPQPRAGSPEQPPSGATDVHALGVILLECLAGRDPAGRPAEVPGDLPPRLQDLLSRMTSPVPQDRPPARACAHVLGEIQPAVTAPVPLVLPFAVPAPQRVEVHQGTTRHVVPRPSPAHAAPRSLKVLAASAGLLVGALAITFATSSVLTPASSTPTGPATQPAPPQASADAPQEEARPQLVGVTRSTDLPQPTTSTTEPAAQEPAPVPDTTVAPTSIPTTVVTTTTASTAPETSDSPAPTTETSASSPAPGTSTLPPDEVED